MKKIIFIILLFSLFILDAKGVSNDRIIKGPITWNDFYYTRINNATGHKSYSYMQMFIRNSDGRAVYCIEPGVLINYDEIYFGYDFNQEIFANISQEVFEKVSLIAYFGYGYQDENYNHTDSIWWAITQWMIWQEANNNHTLYFTQNQNYSGNEPAIERFTEEIAQINSLINTYYTKPNINIPTLVLGQTIELNDTNGVLHNYQVSSCDNCQARIENNKLIITATGIGNTQLNLDREYNNYNNKPIVYISNNSQNALAPGKIDSNHMGIAFFITAGNVSIQKMDADTLEKIPQGDAELGGAIYGVFNISNQLISSLTTNSQGYATCSNIPIGNYYLKEIENSKGYSLDDKRYYFDINSNHLDVFIDVYEKIIEKEVDITKVKANKNTAILEPEEGIIFDFYLQSTNELIESIETDSDGRINLILPYGKYIVHQANAIIGTERINDFVITIDENEPEVISKVIANGSLKAYVKLIKIDEDTNQPIKISGFRFKIKNLDTNQYICQNVSYPNKEQICVFKTNENGVFITPYPLEYGNYQIEELEQEVDGYLLNNNPVLFTIGDNNTYYDDELGLMIDVYFSNKKEPEVVEDLYIGDQINEEKDDTLYFEVPNTEYNRYYLLEIMVSFFIISMGISYVKKREC